MTDNSLLIHHRRRLIHFDLFTKIISKIPEFSSDKGRARAYAQIKKSLLQQGFTHHQRSIYVSNEPLIDAEIIAHIRTLSKNLPWLANCVNLLSVSEVGQVFDGKHFLFEETD